VSALTNGREGEKQGLRERRGVYNVVCGGQREGKGREGKRCKFVYKLGPTELCNVL
jgi:hypothetical protein